MLCLKPARSQQAADKENEFCVSVTLANTQFNYTLLFGPPVPLLSSSSTRTAPTCCRWSCCFGCNCSSSSSSNSDCRRCRCRGRKQAPAKVRRRGQRSLHFPGTFACLSRLYVFAGAVAAAAAAADGTVLLYWRQAIPPKQYHISLIGANSVVWIFRKQNITTNTAFVARTPANHHNRQQICLFAKVRLRFRVNIVCCR